MDEDPARRELGHVNLGVELEDVEDVRQLA